ncbi:hypothetical protein KIL84_001721 [Mauremys mutica]|uniref:Uncharacterized protein n=1 Tax=Mauremys mutica TaxID=74926 RepID=A0A9D3XIW8_9SAUR|nr:hypothetical protein KIL84_001721 [Mauremys mutica]
MPGVCGCVCVAGAVGGGHQTGFCGVLYPSCPPPPLPPSLSLGSVGHLLEEARPAFCATCASQQQMRPKHLGVSVRTTGSRSPPPTAASRAILLSVIKDVKIK